MSSNDKNQLVQKIKNARLKNKPLEEIYSELLSQGYKISEIQSALKGFEQDTYDVEVQNYAISAILTIGAILIGVGVISFIASNWDLMSKFSRVVLLFCCMLTSYFISWWLEVNTNYTRIAKAFLLIGCIVFGATIFLVGQMYNVRGNWPDAFILWFLGVLALALAKNSYELYLLALLIAYSNVIVYPYFIFNILFVAEINDYFNFTPTWLTLVASISAFSVGIYFQYKFQSSSNDNFQNANKT